VIIIGHRGAAGHAPEHTFASYDLALGMGVDYLEQDLRMTQDGVLVVLHDETLDRTTGGTCRGPVNRRTLAAISDCDAGSWFNVAFPDRARTEFAGQRIPTLDAVLARYSGRARFYIETKKPESATGMEEALLALLDQHGLRAAAPDDSRVIIQSFSATSLREIRDVDPRLPLVQLFSRRETGWTIRRKLDAVAKYANGIGPQFGCLDPRLIMAAHDCGLVVHPYTVNDEPVMRRLMHMGVDGMFTDYPDRLARMIAAG
jgi:glycerophosphoryl diester phosphodiesterase